MSRTPSGAVPLPSSLPVSATPADDQEQERRLDDVDAGDDRRDDQRQRVGQGPSRGGGERRDGQERQTDTADQARDIRLTVDDLAYTFSVYTSLSGSITESGRQLMQHGDLD